MGEDLVRGDLLAEGTSMQNLRVEGGWSVSHACFLTLSVHRNSLGHLVKMQTVVQ